MYKIIKQLNGYSGCKVLLVKEAEQIYVKKISASSDYNFRLRKQSVKQRNFIPSGTVLAPKIISYGVNNNSLYEFDMEYIPAKTLAEYMDDISILEIADMIKCLFKSLYFTNEIKNGKANKIFLNKIESLKSILKIYPQLISSFSILENYDWTYVYKTPCHGDLTLENILVSFDKKLYLIDFLDSFYNSWMIDIAKLLQDLDLRWSYRKTQISSNLELRLQIAKEALAEEILKTSNGKEKLNTIYHILLLNILRIYPYTQDNETLVFLDNGIETVLDRIKELNLEKELI